MRKTVLMLLICLGCAFSLPAETPEPAILARGPVEHMGIEYLGVNTIPAQYGEYSYKGDKIIAYFTTETVVLSDEWSAGSCSLTGMMQKDFYNHRRAVAYTDGRGWTVFLSFEQDAEYICRFTSAYRSRQNYFLNIARDKTVFSFPAILEL